MSALFVAGFWIDVGSHFDVYQEFVHVSPGGVNVWSLKPYVRSGSVGWIGPLGDGPGGGGLAHAWRVSAALRTVLNVGVPDAKFQSHGARAATLLRRTAHGCCGGAPPFLAGIAQQPV